MAGFNYREMKELMGGWGKGEREKRRKGEVMLICLPVWLSMLFHRLRGEATSQNTKDDFSNVNRRQFLRWLGAGTTARWFLPRSRLVEYPLFVLQGMWKLACS
jgi:hypothetical protein